MCARHGIKLAGESPVTGSYRPSVANRKPMVVMPGVKEAEEQNSRAYEQKLDMRPNGGQGCISNRNPKGKRKAKTVNQEVVE